ncbi:helix-turn-helix domain-containing protein [Thiocystis minor]|uniref:helix-turn-helix domain-containing protein n=1 Tax=Thiocystis minor TaxID=61597 RepID=UPI001912DD36|nr:helix-turn-helix transcriptional regulator [Thiocystis minor]
METIEASWLDVLFEQSQERRRGGCASTEAFFPIWLKRLRREQSFTQQTLADALDVAYSTVQLWERRHQPGDSKTLPNPHHLAKLRALHRRQTVQQTMSGLFHEHFRHYRNPIIDLIAAALEAGLDSQAEATVAYLANSGKSFGSRQHPFTRSYDAHFASIVFAITQGQGSAETLRYNQLAEALFHEAAASVDRTVLDIHGPLLGAILNEGLGYLCEHLHCYQNGSVERTQGAEEIIDRLLTLYAEDARKTSTYLENVFETACAHLQTDDIQRHGVRLVSEIGADRFRTFFNSLKEISNDRSLLDAILSRWHATSVVDREQVG